MGMKYNDRTGEFEEENRGHKPSTVRSHTTSASSQSSRSSSQGSKVSRGRSSCSSLLVLIVAFFASFMGCYRACSDTTGSSSTSTPQDVPSTYQNVNNAASDFSVSSDAPKQNSSNTSVSSEPAKSTPTYRTEECEEVCTTCKGEGVIPCKVCHGTGTAYSPHNCPQCFGRGYTERSCICGGPSMAGGCSLCGGTGVVKSKCIYCGGSGRQEYAECTRCKGSLGNTELCPTCSGKGYVTKSMLVFD